MRHFRALPVALTLIITLLGACGQQQSDPGVTVTFIHLNDLHAHLTPHTDYVRDGDGWTIAERGGLARIATQINAIRAENPASVLMDIGDTYHGGVEALFTRGNAIVAPVDALEVDVGVPGNWDFAYGPAVTRARYTGQLDGYHLDGPVIEGPSFPTLAANITYTSPPPKAGKPFLRPTLLKNVGGVQVGFIGISSDIVPRMDPALAAGLDFLQGKAAYHDLIMENSAALKAQGAQLVVVMSELGIHKDWDLAKGLPVGVVDVFFSAHTHEATFDPLIADNGVWVMEAGNDTYLGRLDVRLEGGVVVDKQWALLSIGPEVPQDPTMQALVDKARAPFLDAPVDMTLNSPAGDQHLDRPIDTVIGYVAGGMDRRQSLSNSFNGLFTAMLQNYAGTQAAMTPGFRFDAVVAGDHQLYEDPAVVPGVVTIEDAYRMFPVPYTLSTASVDGARLNCNIASKRRAKPV